MDEQFARFSGHWEDLTPADQTLVRMLSGATFAGGASVILPSGRSVTAGQMTELAREARET